MINWFCDRCGKNLLDKDHNRLVIKDGRFMIEIITGVDGTWNDGEICHKCIKEIVKNAKGDDK